MFTCRLLLSLTKKVKIFHCIFKQNLIVCEICMSSKYSIIFSGGNAPRRELATKAGRKSALATACVLEAFREIRRYQKDPELLII